MEKDKGRERVRDGGRGVTLCILRRPRVGLLVYCIYDMLLILYVMDSLCCATPKSKRVLMLAWRHMLLNRWLADSLYFATPKSRRV